ncbi:MAG: RGCVC family protein [Jatrophihabitantaceae bacterium]
MTQVSQAVQDSQIEHEDLPCAACGHLGQAHDPTALRYCRATVASGAERGCLCSPDAGHAGVQPLRTTQPFR